MNDPPLLTRRLREELGISTTILDDEVELLQYSERVPLLTDAPLDEDLDPLARKCLLYNMRKEDLPHIALYYRDIEQRESYIMGNERLFKWVASMAEGSVLERNSKDTAGGTKTERCPACASSFFGYPLKGHSHQQCGFVHLVPEEFVLDLLVANCHAFCGYCNSKSTHHYRDECDKPRQCSECKRWGHQAFHMVCNTPWGVTPAAFKERVTAIRIGRLDRVLYAVNQKFLAIPAPTDYVPRRIGAGLRQNDVIRGTGPVIGDAAAYFSIIPDHVYSWKRYRGLVAVESEPDDVLRPTNLSNGERRFFMILEARAREIYARRFNLQRLPFILIHCYNTPRPRFPDWVYAPGAARLPGPAVDVAVQLELEDEHENDRSSASSNSSSTSADTIASETDLAAIADLVARATIVDGSTQALLRSRIRVEPSFAPKVAALIESCQPDGDGQIQALEKEYEPVRDLKLLFEGKLQKLVIEAMKDWEVRVDQGIYVFSVPTEVVDVLTYLGTPQSIRTLVVRIDSWMITLSGSAHTGDYWSHSSSDEDLLEYHNFLVEIAATFSNSVKCFKGRDSSSAFGRVQVVQKIPTIYEFLFGEARENVRNWANLEAGEIALYQVPKTVFPFNVDPEQLDVGESTPEEELQLEHQLEIVLRTIDPNPNTYEVRADLPHLAVIDRLLGVKAPRARPPLLQRIRVVQNHLTGTFERTRDIEMFPATQLRQYLALWLAMLQPIRVLAEAGKSAPTRLSDCIHELVQGSNQSYEIAFPSFTAFRKETYGFWLSWVHQMLVPTIGRVASINCDCDAHSAE